MVELLVKYGADINQRNKYGDTPLILATESENHVMVKQLVNLGADVNLKNNKGQSPLDLAIAKADWRSARILILAGAEITDPKATAILLGDEFDFPPKDDHYHKTLEKLLTSVADTYHEKHDLKNEIKYLVNAALLGSSSACERLTSPEIFDSLKEKDLRKLRMGFMIKKLHYYKEALEENKKFPIYQRNAQHRDKIDSESKVVNKLIREYRITSSTDNEEIKEAFLKAVKKLKKEGVEERSSGVMHFLKTFPNTSDEELLQSELIEVAAMKGPT